MLFNMRFSADELHFIFSEIRRVLKPKKGFGKNITKNYVFLLDANTLLNTSAIIDVPMNVADQ
jgi:hypothetical protein